MSAVNAPGGHAKPTAAERTVPTYSISELAQEFALTTRAVRFYEDEGLLAPRRRGLARIYGERERTRIKLILRGKRLGLTLSEIRELFDIYATVGNAREFKNGRQLAAWIGLVPSQYSTGGKARLGRITKAGDAYLRNLLVQGARSVLNSAGMHQDRMSRWILELRPRRGYYRTLVAIANKNARIAWALLAKNETLRTI